MTEPEISGHKLPKWGIWVIVGGGGVVAYLVWRNASNTASSSASSASSATDPVTGLTYAQDAAQYGSVAAADAAVTGQQAYSGTPSGGYAYSTGPAAGITGQTYGSNAQWAAAAQSGLTALGYSAMSVAAALGAYLAQLPLSAAQATIVRAAVAEFGAPPTGTYQIIQQGRPPVGSQEPTVPNVDGLDAGQAEQVISSSGFRAAVPGPSGGVIHYVTGQSPAAGTQAPRGSTVHVTVGIRVPDLTGMTAASALATLTRTQLHGSAPPAVRGVIHRVASTSPAAGTLVPLNSIVTLHIR